MLSSTFLRAAVAMVVAGVLLIDVGSPLFARLQLDDVAHAAADTARNDYQRTRSQTQARESATEIAVDRGAALSSFTVSRNGTVELTVSRTASSYVLHRIGALQRFYEVEVSATSAPTP